MNMDQLYDDTLTRDLPNEVLLSICETGSLNASDLNSFARVNRRMGEFLAVHRERLDKDIVRRQKARLERTLAELDYSEMNLLAALRKFANTFSITEADWVQYSLIQEFCLLWNARCIPEDAIGTAAWKDTADISALIGAVLKYLKIREKSTSALGITFQLVMCRHISRERCRMPPKSERWTLYKVIADGELFSKCPAYIPRHVRCPTFRVANASCAAHSPQQCDIDCLLQRCADLPKPTSQPDMHRLICSCYTSSDTAKLRLGLKCASGVDLLRCEMEKQGHCSEFRTGLKMWKLSSLPLGIQVNLLEQTTLYLGRSNGRGWTFRTDWCPAPASDDREISDLEVADDKSNVQGWV